MRTWTRAITETVCGGPRELHTIKPGEPMQAVQMPGVKAKRYRCALCADGPVPPDLPREIVVKPDRAPGPLVRPDFTRVSDVDSPLTRDHRQLRSEGRA